MRDEVARACATLGVEAHASPAEIRRAYKALVKRWHPDRFGSDRSGQAEAAVRMREINAAYRILRDAYLAGAPASAAPPRPAAAPGRRLTREEIEAMVSSIGTQGPIDILVASLRWYGSMLRVPFFVFYALGVLARASTVLRQGGLAALPWDTDLLILVLLGVAYLVWRRREAARETATSRPWGSSLP